MQYNDAVSPLTMRPWLGSAVLAAMAAATYANALHGAFQYDDLFTILINPHLDRWQIFVDHLDHMVRPVLYATFLIDRRLFGHSPTGYHVLNLLLHLGSGLLLYRILTRAVSEHTQAVPFWTALLFLIHPITTETVTYISGRASGLMAFFYLLAFFLYVKASERQNTDSRRRLYVSGAVASSLMSIGAKETAVTFPLVILLWDVLIARSRGPSLRAGMLSRHLPFWLVLLLAAGWASSHPRYAALAHFSVTLRPLWDNALSEVHAVAYALVLFFCPWRQNFDHDLPEFHSLWQWPLPLDALLLLGVAAAGLAAGRRLPLLAFGIGWFFIQLLPVSLIPRADLLSERNLYLASVGLFLAVVLLGSSLIRWALALRPDLQVGRVVGNGLAIILVLVLCLFTYQRNTMYGEPVALWSDTIGKSPNKARPHNNLGHAYALRGDWELAIEEFRAAAKLDPDSARARTNLRDAYLRQVGRQ